MAYCATKNISTQGLSVLVFVLHIYLVYCVSTTIPSAISDDVVIRESVVIPSSVNSEQEARELYDQALKQYGSYGSFARNICSTWERRGCQCSGGVEELALSCRSVGFEEIPLDLPAEIVKLDLGDNNITYLPSKSFDTVPHLEELVLSDNTISKIDSEAFIGLHKLKRLSLHNCGLTVVPGEALKRIRGLTTLNLGSNHLFSINEGDFPLMENLHYLLLKRNRISNIATGSIGNLTKLKVLDLDDNVLSAMPTGLDQLTHLQELFLSGNKIRWISKDDLPSSITTLELKANPLVGIKTGALQNMPRLRKLVLSEARNLKDVPSLEGCVSLETLRMDRASLSSVPSDLCLNSPRLKSLVLKSNKLRSIPELASCKDLRIL